MQRSGNGNYSLLQLFKKEGQATATATATAAGRETGAAAAAATRATASQFAFSPQTNFIHPTADEFSHFPESREPSTASGSGERETET